MKAKETELLLIEAKMYRNQGQFAEALENLHRVVNAHPDNLKYKYLLASTYFEAGSDDAATQYAQEVIDAEPSSKEALELLGLINIREKNFDKAESFFRQALAIDPQFHNARFNLIKLYDEHFKNDEELMINGLYMLSNRDIDKYSLSYKKKMAILLDWYAYVYGRTKDAMARLGMYDKAIKVTEELIHFYNSCSKAPRPTETINEYGNIYKFLYLSKNKEKLNSFKDKYKEIFSLYTDCEKDFKFWEELADKKSF